MAALSPVLRAAGKTNPVVWTCVLPVAFDFSLIHYSVAKQAAGEEIELEIGDNDTKSRAAFHRVVRFLDECSFYLLFLSHGLGEEWRDQVRVLTGIECLCQRDS